MSLSSIFCCSRDTTDDNEENFNKPNRDRNYRGTTIDASNKNNKPKRQPLRKDKDKEDSSINETETIANTNEDTPNGNVANNHSSLETSEGSSNGTKNPQNDDVIIAQSGDEDVVDLNLQDMDEESIMDLAKFQEGQYRDPATGWLLPAKDEKFKGKKCLILDLDETLVHSSFKYLRTADFVIPVEIDNQVHHVYVIKRPGVDEFLKKVGQWFEVVVFTASVSKYGNPLLDKLDINKAVHHRLFRDSCYNYEGNFIKNLSQIGRPLSESIIIDNSPASYIFHPQHSVPISSWFSDTHDNELLDLLPFLHDLSKQNVDDVSLVLDVMI